VSWLVTHVYLGLTAIGAEEKKEQIQVFAKAKEEKSEHTHPLFGLPFLIVY